MHDPDQVGPRLSRLVEPEIRAWRGEADLATVFWGYGVLASAGLTLLHATALTLRQVALQQALILVTALYSLWILVAIWRCAAGASLFWGTLARWLTVAWALNSGLVLAFLQLGLLARLLGG